MVKRQDILIIFCLLGILISGMVAGWYARPLSGPADGNIEYQRDKLLGLSRSLSTEAIELRDKNTDTELQRKKLLELNQLLNSEVMQLRNLVEYVPPSPVSIYNYQELVDLGHMVAPVGNTGSMEPIINGTTKVVLSKEPARIGDIAVYVSGNQTIIHRIIGETTDGRWIFKGDNNKVADLPVSKDQVIWRVEAILY